MSATAFRVRDLTVLLDGRTGLRRVLAGVDLEVRTGKTFALVGESGSGKTCLVQSVLGLHGGEPGVVGGSAEVLGRDVFGTLVEKTVSVRPEPLEARKDMAAWRRGMRARWKGDLGREVTLIPQDAITSLSPFHTVGEMLTFAVRRGNPGLDADAVRAEALNWLTRVEMYDVENVSRRYVHELSGGMAQRVAIALALAPCPSLVIADEPTTGLDATLRIQLITLLSTIVREEGLTLFLVTHDNAAARILASDVAVLYAGLLMEGGPADKVLAWGAAPKHPYTSYLLEAERRLTQGENLSTSPRARMPEAGCPFAPHCDRAVRQCGQASPPLTEVAPGHRIACWAKGS